MVICDWLIGDKEAAASSSFLLCAFSLGTGGRDWPRNKIETPRREERKGLRREKFG
jgi:hypothetical protein